MCAAQRIGSAAAAGLAKLHNHYRTISGKPRLRGAAEPLSDWSRCWAAFGWFSLYILRSCCRYP